MIEEQILKQRELEEQLLSKGLSEKEKDEIRLELMMVRAKTYRSDAFVKAIFFVFFIFIIYMVFLT